jgi:integrase/recombinase XerD
MLLRRKRQNVGGTKKPVAIEHTGFYAYLLRYNETMKVRGYATPTLHRRESDIRRFIGWCDDRSLDKPQDITKPILERYQHYLHYYRQRNGDPLTMSSQNRYMVSIKQFFKWLTQQNYLLYNPASELFIPKSHPSLPLVLSVDEVELILQQPDIHTPLGVRDRAMLEVFYSTAMRRSELCDLTVGDVSLSQKTVFIRKGKGGKDRVVPVGDRALHWVQRYLQEVRPQLLLSIQEQRLFLSDYGETFCSSKLGDRVRRYIKHSGLTMPGSCHLFRHACATHMLENGADLRYLQVLLGHTNTNTTQIYTHVSIRKLQEIHTQTHPAKWEDHQTLLQSLADEMEEENEQDGEAVSAVDVAIR